MPRFDGTGPKGRGPLTGRGMGYCAVRLPSEADTGPSPGWPRNPGSGGFSYPSRGLRNSHQVQFAPGAPWFGRVPNRGSQRGSMSRLRSTRLAREED